MLYLNFDGVRVTKNTESALAKFKKKVDHELSYFPGVDIVFNISQKSKKQNVISMSVQSGSQILMEQEFASRSWESALEQCVQDSLWGLKQQFTMQRQVKRLPIVY